MKKQKMWLGYLILFGAIFLTPGCSNGPTDSEGNPIDGTVTKSDAGSNDNAGTDAGSKERKICQPGTSGCRCTPTGACFDGLRCDVGVCSTCTEGTAGCACKGDKTCSSGLRCESGRCLGCVGKDKCPCYGNNSCDSKHKCDISFTSVSLCQACDSKKSEGCNCDTDADCGSLACVNRKCINLAKANAIPQNPPCYQSCDKDIPLANGQILVCHPEYKLAEGCPKGQTCNEGSCVPTKKPLKLDPTAYPFCSDDAGCPTFQTCLAGRCYSTCSSSTQCQSGFNCHLYVCRRKCTLSNNVCTPSQSCLTTGSDQGVCMPKSTNYNPAPPQTKTSGSVQVAVNNLEFTNVVTTSELVIFNKGEFEATFTIKRERDNIGSPKPLFWLRFDKCVKYSASGSRCEKFEGKPSAAEPFVLKINPSERNGRAIIQISNGAGKPKDKSTYEGSLTIKAEQMNEQHVRVSYIEKADGQWKGTMVAFGNFNDVNLDKFLSDPNVQINDMKNALLRRWLNYKRRPTDFTKFRAMLRSLREGTWSQAKVRKECKTAFSTTASADVVCYPYSTSKGYEVLSNSAREAPPPSGISELNFVINVIEQDKKTWDGRISTAQTLQYSGNPYIRLTFEKDPDPKANLNVLKTFNATIDLGGRFAIQKKDSCAGDFKKATIPWMVPGFEIFSEAVTGSIFRERYECRNFKAPLAVPGDATSEEKALIELKNMSSSSSNPVPNGWRLRRKLELLDGGLIENKYLFVLYKERFVSFFQTSADDRNIISKDFVNYGYMLLARSPTELTKNDFVGNRPPATAACKDNTECTGGKVCRRGECQPSNKLSQVTCAPDIVLTATNKAIADASDLHPAAQWPKAAVEDLVTRLITGQAAGTSMEVSSDTRGDVKYVHNGKTYYVHYYCEDTRQFDGGPTNDPQGCPAGSKVTYFALTGKSTATLRSAFSTPCQEKKSCDTAFESYKKLPDYRANVPYRCKNANQVFCDDPTDLRQGKVFFKPTQTGLYVSPLASLPNAMYQAFRYRLKFVSRSGKSIGFTPTICQPGTSTQTPYCYDPKAIEQIEKRVNCLEYIYSTKTLQGRISPTVLATLKNFLTFSFSFKNRNVNGVLFTDFGFETLNAELKVMLGDESYTRSFASRYDLAGSSQVGFQGELLEPNGINLSGALGYEMYNLYLSTQYYQIVLDRFFSQTNVLYASFLNSNTAFITAGSVTSYFEKLLLASTRKARSFSQIAKRYHQLNRTDLARAVIERSYAASFMEMTILTRLLRQMTEITDRKEIDQISQSIDKITLTYKSALLDMEETYKKLSQSISHFGFPEGYIPFPAMDSFSALTGGTNAFQVSLQFAKEKMNIAQVKEQQAIASKRSFDTNAASFQGELARIEANYEGQLLEICGGISVTTGDGQVRTYPAIPKYSTLSDQTKTLGNPCGLLPGGSLYNSYAELEKMRISLQSLQQSMQGYVSQSKLEETRIKTYCDNKFALTNITLAERTKQHNLQLEIEDAQRQIDRTVRIGQTASQAAEMIKCSLIVGVASGGDCPTTGIAIAAVLGVGALTEGLVGAQEGNLAKKREEILKNERLLESTQYNFECSPCKFTDTTCDRPGTAQVESNIKLKELAMQIMNLSYEALKAEIDIRIASSNITRLHQQARRLITQQNETTQLTLNVQAAQNDPNTRIYKNDAIISAERTYEEAMREAARATLVYEYYTGSTYKKKGELYLIRMISYGDKNLEAYISQLEQAFREFEEVNGKPDIRVVVLSLRDDILKVATTNENKTVRTLTERVSEFQKKLSDRNRLNEEGFTSFPFNLSLTRTISPVSPITFNHKVLYIEAELIGSEIGDTVGRLYLRQKGTGLVRLRGDDTKYYALPQRTAVLNPFFNGTKVFTPEIYKNFRLRDRPLGNTQWELLINQMSEKANQDINLNSVNDIRLYIYYTDFTEE